MFGLLGILDDLYAAVVDGVGIQPDLLQEVLVDAFTGLAVFLFVAGVITEVRDPLGDLVRVDDPVVDEIREASDRRGEVAVDLEVQRVVAAEGV